MLRVFAEHGVEFVMIGGLAAAMHGSDHVTTDLDITPGRDVANVERLSAALEVLGARIRVEGIEGGLAFAHDSESLLRAGVWNLTTQHGDLDLSFVPSGTEGWEDLSLHAIVVDLDGTRVSVAALDDIIRSKEAADRPKDRLVLPSLRHLRDVIGDN
jgi:hypothetical protein